MEDQESHAKLSAKDAKNLLREMRKEHVPAVSRMHKRDVLAEIERLKVKREETPPVAATPAARPKKQNPMVESIKEAKAKEFPVAPESAPMSDSKTKKGEPRKTARKAYITPTKTEVVHEEKMYENAHKGKKAIEPEKKSAPEPKKSAKPAKGSPEMAAKMAMIRAMRKKKDSK